MARTQRDKNAGTYAHEAVSEWGKAVRYGVRALAAKRREGSKDRPPLKERLNPSKTDKGGRVGDAADMALSKFGIGGKLASKVSLGSRILERVRGGKGADEEGEISDSNGFAGRAPGPIQESIDVAVPVREAFALCTRFAEYPEFLHRVADVEDIDESHATFTTKVRGRERELEVQLLDEWPNERLDWECANEIEHSGVISFHPLAPRLTRLELTIQLQPHGLVERLARRVHLTERVIREEMHRFKAYAELWEQSDEEEPQGSVEPDEESVEPEDEEPQEDEPEAEGEGDLLDEEDLEEEDFDEDDLEEEELEEEQLESEELEPVGSER